MTRLAIWWLQRCGYFLVPPGFIGLIVGNCSVVQMGQAWLVSMPPIGHVVALNQSIVLGSRT
jgi:hypothetical protein